jgi:Zn-dependent metalloprotease
MKNLTRFSSLIFTILLATFSVTGQSQTFEFSSVKTNTAYDIPWYGELSTNYHWTESEFLSAFTNTYFEGHNVSFEETKRSTDKIGFTHIRLQQHISGIHVNHGVLNIHIKDGIVESFNGELYKTSNPNNAEFDYEAVKDMFLSTFKDYASWTFLDETENSKGIYCPNTNGSSLEYCYRFRVVSPDNSRDDYVFFNPNQYSLTRLEPQLIHTDSVGTAKTFYRGTKPVTTDFISSNSFRMKQNGKPINTYDTRLGNYVTDADNSWTTTGKEIAGDVHYAVDLLHTFMDSTFGWDSYANNGDSITSVLNFTGSGNAFWNLAGNYSTFLVAKTTSVNPCAAIDVIGHEFGHGIADENAGLVYSGESCMLHESFADIAGSTLEHHEDSSKSNWLLGEEVWVSRGGIRNMKTPKAMRHPDTYKGQYWAGGCHNNGEVQNHWFYMMVEGDTGTNDNGVVYDIPGLGRDSATQIIFRAMFYYVTPNTKFEDMASATLKATKDLYGTCGKELQMVWDAWEAAGVIDTTVQLTNFDHGIVAPTLRCTFLPAIQKFSSIGDPSREILWTYGVSADTSTQFVFEKTLTNFGVLNVMLRTEVCNKVFFDTLDFRLNSQPEAQFTPSQTEFCTGFDDTLFTTNTTVNADKNQTLYHEWDIQPYDLQTTGKNLSLPLKDLQFYFSIELRSFYKTGCESKKKVFISPVQVSSASFTSKSVCQGADIILKNTSDTTRPVTFDWKIDGDKMIDAEHYSDYEPVVNLKRVQDVIITLSATDDATNCVTTHADTIEIYKNPEPTWTYSNACYGDTVIFINTTNHPTSITWFKWDFGFFRPFNKDTTFNIATKAEPMLAGLEVRDDNGCKVIVHDTIEIEETIAKFDVDSFCLNDIKPFANKSVGTSLSYSWQFGNGSMSADTNGLADYTQADDYEVTLTASSPNCDVSQSSIVRIWESPVADFDVSGICIGDTVQFTSKSEVGINNTTYEWRFGDGDTADQTDPTHSYDIDVTTSYFVSLILKNTDGCNDRKNKTITIHELPHCGFDYEYAWPSRDVVFQADSSLYKNYKWYFGDGDSSSEVNPTHDYATEDSFTVTLIVTNSAGCECAYITQVRGANVSVRDFQTQNITLYPNPNKGSFSIKSDLKGEVQVRMVDVYGRLVHEEKTTSAGLIHIDTDVKAAGAYMIMLLHNGDSYTIPVLIE